MLLTIMKRTLLIAFLLAAEVMCAQVTRAETIAHTTDSGPLIVLTDMKVPLAPGRTCNGALTQSRTDADDNLPGCWYLDARGVHVAWILSTGDSWQETYPATTFTFTHLLSGV